MPRQRICANLHRSRCLPVDPRSRIFGRAHRFCSWPLRLWQFDRRFRCGTGSPAAGYRCLFRTRHTPGSQFESWKLGTLTIGEIFSRTTTRAGFSFRACSIFLWKSSAAGMCAMKYRQFTSVFARSACCSCTCFDEPRARLRFRYWSVDADDVHMFRAGPGGEFSLWNRTRTLHSRLRGFGRSGSESFAVFVPRQNARKHRNRFHCHLLICQRDAGLGARLAPVFGRLRCIPARTTVLARVLSCYRCDFGRLLFYWLSPAFLSSGVRFVRRAIFRSPALHCALGRKLFRI